MRLAGAALLLGGVAALWCWVPLVDLLSIACAGLALALGTPVLVQAGRRRRAGAAVWMAVVAVLLAALALVVSGVALTSAATAVLELVDELQRQTRGA